MKIRVAGREDLELLGRHDKHISKEELECSIDRGRIYVAEEGAEFIGWLRFNLFWDSIPFMNMLYFLDDYRGKGYGRQLVDYWEGRMRALGFDCVMTSTQSDEYAQHFYVKLGYRAIGGFSYRADPYEIIFMKELKFLDKRPSLALQSLT